MNPAEVVEQEEHRHGSDVVRQFLAVGVREPRKSTHPHANREVVPLNVRRGYVLSIRQTEHRCFLRSVDPWWAVLALRASLLFARFTVAFHKLCIIHVRAEGVLDRVHVSRVTVARKLDAARDSACKIKHELIGVRLDAAPDPIRDNELLFSDRSPGPAITPPFKHALLPDVLCLRADERPDFVGLDSFGLQAANMLIVIVDTGVAETLNQPENSGFRHTGHADRRIDARALK